jgi:serine/threonine protein phosphatase PrpC
LDNVGSLEEAKMVGDDAAYAFWNRNMVSSGLNGGPIDTVQAPAEGVAAVILTSDGIHDNLCQAEVQRVASEAFAKEGITGVAEALVVAAKKRAGSGVGRAKPDDITAVVLPTA